MSDSGGRLTTPAIPERLRLLVDQDRATPIEQPAVEVQHERWSKRLREHDDVIQALPAYLDRRAVRAFALRCADSPTGAVAAFIASQIWGYGTTGYGPYRLAEAVSHPELPAALQTARTSLRAGQPIEAFRALCVDRQIAWTGTSFGSKYLYFTDPHARALILDRFVSDWLAEHAGLSLRAQRDDRVYSIWLRVAERWASELGVASDRLEMIVFSDSLGRRSSWRPRRGVGVHSAHETSERMTCAGAIARVLEDAGRPMRAAQIAVEINRRGLYQRSDGQPLPAYQVSSIAHGNRQRFQITSGSIALAGAMMRPPAAPARAQDRSVRPTCVLIGCVSRKEPTARPAKDLYRTELFSRRRAYAEASGRPWLIVSALHGVVDPDKVIEPYDVRIADLDLTQRRVLAEGIARDLQERFGDLAEASFEVHAGDEYMQVLKNGPGSRGARLTNPLRGLRIGEQLAWYGRHGRTEPAPRPAATQSHPEVEPDESPRHLGLAQRISAAFQAGELDLTLRPEAPRAGWAGMPEVAVADRLRAAGARDREVRSVVTFTAAMDRARDADALWFAAARLFEAEPWAFVPADIVARSLTELADVLRSFRVSQRHGPDAAAWRVIAESLDDQDAAPAVRRAVLDGVGDAGELLGALQASSPGGTARFPFLRGPKVGPMWVRMMSHPGGGRIESLEVLPVAVDVQVRKVTEYLGVTDTGDLDLDGARPVIQAAWSRDVRDNGAEGPGPLNGSAAALDPALWFWAKWGCTRCERANRKLPIGTACNHCRFPARS